MSEEKEPMTVDRAIEECEAQIAIEQANVDMKIGCVECSKGHIDFLKKCLESLERERQDAFKAAEYKKRWMHAVLRLYRIDELKVRPVRMQDWLCEAHAERNLPDGRTIKIDYRLGVVAAFMSGDDSSFEEFAASVARDLDEKEKQP